MIRHIGAATLAASLLAACTTTSPDASGGNPLFAGADPSVLVHDGRLWLFPTGGGGLYGWTRTAQGWTRGPRLIGKDDIAWIDDDGAPVHHLWAPDMVAANGRFYFYYSVGPQTPTPSRIGVAVADRIEGPFVDSGKPLLTGGDGFEAIDPMVFDDAKSGKTYLLAGGSAGATLRMFELAPDRVSIAREIDVTQPPKFTEGAFLHERNGTYYLSYSHGSWQRSSYSVHYATASSPTGPWTYRGPILTSTDRYKGPGHHAFYVDPDRGWSIAYHRWEEVAGDGPYRGSRKVAIEPITYRADGTIAPITMTP